MGEKQDLIPHNGKPLSAILTLNAVCVSPISISFVSNKPKNTSFVPLNLLQRCYLI